MSSNLLKSSKLDVIGYYYIEDLGDGSAAVRFYKHKADAERDDQYMVERGLGSISDGVHELRFDHMQEHPYYEKDDE